MTTRRSQTLVDAGEFLIEQLMRDRSREVWEFCDELAMLSRFSDELDHRTAEQWRTVVDEIAKTGRSRIDAMVAHYVRETNEERRESLTQGSLF